MNTEQRLYMLCPASSSCPTFPYCMIRFNDPNIVQLAAMQNIWLK